MGYISFDSHPDTFISCIPYKRNRPHPCMHKLWDMRLYVLIDTANTANRHVIAVLILCKVWESGAAKLWVLQCPVRRVLQAADTAELCMLQSSGHQQSSAAISARCDGLGHQSGSTNQRREAGWIANQKDEQDKTRNVQVTFFYLNLKVWCNNTTLYGL